MATSTFPSYRIQPRPEFADILRDTERYKVNPEDEGVGSRINGWFDQLMVQSGLQTSPSMMLLYCLCSGILVGGLLFVLQEHPLLAGTGALIGGFLPLAIALVMRSRRQKKIMQQMPGMMEELSRAARTGRSLEQSLQLVAEDVPAPLGDELKICAKKVELGLPIREALRTLPENTGINSLNVFVMALAIHQETGGDLVRVLERLSHTIRDRMLFLGRLRAATTASRATAILMVVLPPSIIAFFMVRDSSYLTRLFSSNWGTGITLLAVALEVIGSLWVLRILKNSART